MDDEVVKARARAAVLWCHNATTHALANQGKPWSYLLIPHDAITSSTTLKALAATFLLT